MMWGIRIGNVGIGSRTRRRIRAGALGSAMALAAVSLTGCGTFGGGDRAADAAATPVAAPTVTADASTAIDPATGQPQRKIIVDFDPATECPQVMIMPGASSFATYDGPPSPASVRYQLSIENFARECILVPGNQVQIRIGIEGHAVIGEKGGSGTVSAPLRLAVRNRDDQVLSQKVVTVSATIPPGGAQGSFKLVDDSAVVPISLDRPLRTLQIQIGFDQGGAVAPTASRKPKRVRRG